MSSCSAISIYPLIADLMRELFYQDALSDDKRKQLIKALDSYHDIECDAYCEMPQCPYVRPTDWVTSVGYTSLSDLLDHYEYKEGVVPVMGRKSLDALKAKWARRPGHYKP